MGNSFVIDEGIDISDVLLEDADNNESFRIGPSEANNSSVDCATIKHQISHLINEFESLHSSNVDIKNSIGSDLDDTVYFDCDHSTASNYFDCDSISTESSSLDCDDSIVSLPSDLIDVFHQQFSGPEWLYQSGSPSSTYFDESQCFSFKKFSSFSVSRHLTKSSLKLIDKNIFFPIDSKAVFTSTPMNFNPRKRRKAENTFDTKDKKNTRGNSLSLCNEISSRLLECSKGEFFPNYSQISYHVNLDFSNKDKDQDSSSSGLSGIFNLSDKDFSGPNWLQ